VSRLAPGWLGPFRIDHDEVRVRRCGDDSGSLPGWERWELRDDAGQVIAHTALRNGASDTEGLARFHLPPR
jgi:hypothetical protein